MKILRSLVIMLTLVGVSVAGTLALLSDNSSVQGLTVSSGGADIQLSGGATTPTTWVESYNFNDSQVLPKVYPGYGVSPLNPASAMKFHIKNNSSAVIPLDISMKLTAADGWGSPLKSAVQLLLQNNSNYSQTTGWLTLEQWNAGNVPLPGGSIAQNSYRTYNVYVRVPYEYGSDHVNGFVNGVQGNGTEIKDELEGLTLSGITFAITGTQAI